MRLSTTGRYLIAIVLVAWIAVLALLMGMKTADSATVPHGAVNRAVTAAGTQGMGIIGVVPQDLYGEEWVAAAIVCPGTTAEDIETLFDADSADFRFGEQGIEETDNYLLLRSADGGQAVDRVARAEVDLCTVPLGGYFDSRVMLPLGKTEDGGWALLN